MKNRQYEIIAQKIIQLERMMHDIIREQKNIREVQELGLVGKKSLVIIHDNYKTRVYKDGKDITDGIKDITFIADELPVIEYKKTIY